MKKTNGFKKYIPGFEKRLQQVVVERVSAELYCRTYLGHLLEHKFYYLEIYADVLDKLVLHPHKDYTEMILVDFGAGNGMLGLFAKYCGFKKVLINDIDESFVEASKQLAKQLDIFIDGYVAGDIEAVREFFKSEKPDAIVGTDVIEHIYDLTVFFKTIREINPQLISVFTTASNPKNYFKIKKLKELQVRDEYEGGSPDDFTLFGAEPLEPFIEMRKRIIQAELPVTDNSFMLLSKVTRGMNKKDILMAVEDYKRSGKVPAVIAHPTNTCNPLNSSWTERILSIDEYKSLYESNVMQLEVYNGFYDAHKTGLKKYLNKLLNMVVKLAGIRFAPFIIFSGRKK